MWATVRELVAISEASFMIVGSLSGVVLATTTGWLITGGLCHRFQKETPLTWRRESWRQHALAVLWSGMGGCALGALDSRVAWGHSSILAAIGFGGLAWSALGAPVIATLATYVNLHRMVVAGLLLEWLFFAVGVSAACRLWAG